MTWKIENWNTMLEIKNCLRAKLQSRGDVLNQWTWGKIKRIYSFWTKEEKQTGGKKTEQRLTEILAITKNLAFVLLGSLTTHGKESACNAGDLGLILGSGRSSKEGNGNPLQYSYLENPMERGAWWLSVHGVTKSWTLTLTEAEKKGESAERAFE